MPIDSLYQATKSSIEQGIYELQQKLRRKNQLDLERQLAHNLLQQQKLYRHEKDLIELQKIYQHNLNYNNTLLQRTAPDPYVNSFLYESSLNDPVGFLELKDAIRKQTQHLEYLKRLQRIKQQSLALENRAENGQRAQMYDDQIIKHSSPIQHFQSNQNSPGRSRTYNYQKSPTRPESTNKHLQYDQPIEQDSSTLLQKYSKGIRAQEYNRDMLRLIEAEKRIRKNYPQPSATKVYDPIGNQSIVMPYQTPSSANKQLQYGRHKDTEREKQSTGQQEKIYRLQNQRAVSFSDTKKPEVIKRPDQIEPRLKENSEEKQIFENEKIGQVINKRQANLAQKSEQIPASNNISDLMKKSLHNPNLNPSISPYKKTAQTRRPYTANVRKANQQQASRLNNLQYSALGTNRSQKSRRKPQTSTKKSVQHKASQQNTSRTINDIMASYMQNTDNLPLPVNVENMMQFAIKKKVNQSIQRRLKLLTCIFKDAEYTYDRNEVMTLAQRFQIESKARKQLRTIINNNPRILKKHKMVVE